MRWRASIIILLPLDNYFRAIDAPGYWRFYACFRWPGSARRWSRLAANSDFLRDFIYIFHSLPEKCRLATLRQLTIPAGAEDISLASYEKRYRAASASHVITKRTFCHSALDLRPPRHSRDDIELTAYTMWRHDIYTPRVNFNIDASRRRPVTYRVYRHYFTPKSRSTRGDAFMPKRAIFRRLGSFRRDVFAAADKGHGFHDMIIDRSRRCAPRLCRRRSGARRRMPTAVH